MSFFYSAKGWLKRICRQGPYFQRLSGQLNGNLALNKKAIEQYQFYHLQKMIDHCYNNVPYYTDLFNRIGLRCDSIRQLKDLEKVPLLDKHIVKENYDKLIARNQSNLFSKTAYTSGTTGMPAKFLRDYHSINMENALVWRFRRQADHHSKRRIIIRGDLIVPASRQAPPFWKYNAASRELVMSAYHLSPGNSKYYIEKILDFRPEIMIAFPSIAFLLAKYFKTHHVEYGFDAVFTSSECLEPFIRDYVENMFQTRIYDWYGQAERVAAVAQCRYGTYHVQEDYSIVELMSTAGSAEIIGTHLHNSVMPLLRYCTGDTVIPTESGCACGQNFRAVREIVGRTIEPLITPEGNPIVCAPAFVFKGIDSVLEGQFYQEKQGEVTIRVLTRNGLDAKEEHALMENTLKYTSPHMQIRIEEVPKIERGKNGKYLGVINKCYDLKTQLEMTPCLEPRQKN